MKTFNLLLCLFLGVLFFSPRDSHAQWQPDVRLTIDPSGSFTSSNNAWCIASSGDFVHVVWFDERDGNREIYYKRSTDGGVSWGADSRLTNNSAVSELPSVSVSGTLVHVVWIDERDGNQEIYYKRSTDGGISWGVDTGLTSNSAISGYPSVTVSGLVVHVVWRDTRDGNLEIYYKRSIDGGSSWEADTRLTSNSADSWNPSVSASGLAVHVLWLDHRDGNLEIYYKRSTDGGISWGTDARLTNNSAISGYPSVTVSGSVVHVVWRDTRDGNDEVYYKRSTDGGISWEADTRLTNDPALSRFPSVAASGQVVHVVWHENRDGNYEIYYKRSTDGGINWGADTRLTNNSAASEYASISVSGIVVHVVWYDFRDGNYEIYYKRDPSGNPVGIENTDSEIPKEFALYQNYPNPFNPSTRIQFTVPRSSNVALKVYNLLGQEVATLVSQELTAGKYSTQWIAHREAGGIYFYRLQAGSFVETKKLVLLR